MGNIIQVTDKEGKEIGQVSHNLMCAMYVSQMVEKYNPEFNMFSCTKNINDQLKPVYEKCTPEDELILLIFMNDESSFEEKDLPNFDKAIAKLDENNDFHKIIKNHLEKYRDYVKEFKYINTKYVGVR